MSGSPELDLLLREIGEQPDVVARVLERQAAAVRDVASTIRAREPSAIVLVAREARTTRRSTDGICSRCAIDS